MFKSGDSPVTLEEVDLTVVDSHRIEMKVPAIEIAKARVAKQNEQLEKAKKPNQALEPTATAGAAHL